MTTHLLHTLQETHALATQLAMAAHSGDLFLLYGDLGAGKSTLARAFIHALCGAETVVPSPTFTLVQEYDSPRGPIYHYDLYRLDSAESAYELGIEENFHHGICLVEWPQKLDGLILPPATAIHFTHTGAMRTAEVHPPVLRR